MNLNNFKKVMQAFKQGDPLSASRDSDSTYVSTGELLLIRQFQKNFRFDSQGKSLKTYVIGLKTKTEVIGNSSIVSLERERDYRNNDQVLEEQLIMSQAMTMIPFSVMKEAGLSLYTFKEVARGNEETLMRKVERLMTQVAYDRLDQKLVISCEELTEKSAIYRADSSMKFKVEYYEPQHFTGPRLFQCLNEKKEVSTYLLDVDRNELPHGLINPFLVKLSDSTVTSIQEAYESLKPSEVIQAEEKELKVLRQGEWFFIETTVNESFLNKALEKQAEERKQANRWSDGKRGELRAGRNRPNTVQFFVELNGSYFIKGNVSHTGREHKDLDLKGWYQALPNTATESWTISGNID